MKIVLCVLIPGVLFLLAYANCAYVPDWDDSKFGYMKHELLDLAKYVPIIAREDQFTAATWDGINDMKDFASLLAPHFEEGEQAFIDPWRNQFILEKREQGDMLIVTIRSSRQLADTRWCHWRGPGILGVELTVSRASGQVIQTRKLWNY
jgi:hypothetical protein